MAKQTFISDAERKKCKKISDVFADLYDQIDIVVKDAGIYGFVKLHCFEPNYGFHKLTTFTDSKALFDNLWQEWWQEQVFSLALGTPLLDLDYAEILKALPNEKQLEIMSKRTFFEEKCSQKLPSSILTTSAVKEKLTKKKQYITDAEHEKCKKVAAAFSILEQEDIVILDVGRYGFVTLFYYTPPHGFEIIETFTDSQKMFDYLWREWLDSQLIRLAASMKMDDIDYDTVFATLPEQRQTELLGQRDVFLQMADFKIISCDSSSKK